MNLSFILQVVVFQEYENQSSEPIEAKYVFPLDDKAVGVYTITTIISRVILTNLGFNNFPSKITNFIN